MFSFATPLTSHASTFWLSPSADSQTQNSLCSRPLRAYSHLENCESRNSLEVSQSCGLKNDLLCSRPLRALQPLVQQTSSGPAVTWRTVNELLRQSPLCQVGCATFPEDFTCPVSLGDTGQCYWTSRRLHLSRHTGQARTTGRQKPSLVLSTGQARTTGSCVETARDSVSVTRASSRVISTPLLWDLKGVTSTDRIYLPTFPTTGKTTHTKP